MSTGTWTDAYLTTLPDGRIECSVTTNDNADRGIPDEEESWVLTYPSLADVPASYLFTHVGLYGQPVRVFLDGREVLEDPRPLA